MKNLGLEVILELYMLDFSNLNIGHILGKVDTAWRGKASIRRSVHPP